MILVFADCAITFVVFSWDLLLCWSCVWAYGFVDGLSGCMVFGGFWLRGFGCGLFWFGLFFTGRYDGGVYRLLMFVFWVVGRLVLFACWVFACGGLFKLCLVVLAVAVGLAYCSCLLLSCVAYCV